MKDDVYSKMPQQPGQKKKQIPPKNDGFKSLELGVLLGGVGVWGSNVNYKIVSDISVESTPLQKVGKDEKCVWLSLARGTARVYVVKYYRLANRYSQRQMAWNKADPNTTWGQKVLYAGDAIVRYADHVANGILGLPVYAVRSLQGRGNEYIQGYYMYAKWDIPIDVAVLHIDNKSYIFKDTGLSKLKP